MKTNNYPIFRPLISTYFILILSCLIIISCKEDSGNNADPLIPDGSLTNFTDCKNVEIIKHNEIAEAGTTSIQWEYAGTTLKLKHINAAFNCCPDGFNGEVKFDDNLITIEATENESGCRCNCLYDLDFELTELPVGNYHIRVVEQYGTDDDEKLDFDVDLNENTNGIYSVQRNRYPWEN